MNDPTLPIDFDSSPYKDVKVGIEFITPADAAELKASNYKFNRELIKQNVNDLKKMMLDGEFLLSSDAVVVDTSGTMKNAQHRIEAVLESGIGQWFLVMRNVSHDIGAITDTGRSRKMADRITFSGTKISRRECSIVRNAMCDIQSPTIGVMQFSKPWQDAKVKDTFLRFQDYFNFLSTRKYLSTMYSPILLGAGLKIWAHMKNNNDTYLHDMCVEDRFVHWIEISSFGQPSTFMYNPSIDGAAARLYHEKRKKRDDNPGAGFWNDSPALRKTVHAAHKFMNGENFGRNVVAITVDPFKLLRKMQPTNPKYALPEGIAYSRLNDFILGE